MKFKFQRTQIDEKIGNNLKYKTLGKLLCAQHNISQWLIIFRKDWMHPWMSSYRYDGFFAASVSIRRHALYLKKSWRRVCIHCKIHICGQFFSQKLTFNIQIPHLFINLYILKT